MRNVVLGWENMYPRSASCYTARI